MRCAPAGAADREGMSISNRSGSFCSRALACGRSAATFDWATEPYIVLSISEIASGLKCATESVLDGHD